MAGSLTSSIKYNSLNDGKAISINIKAGVIVHINSINVPWLNPQLDSHRHARHEPRGQDCRTLSSLLPALPLFRSAAQRSEARLLACPFRSQYLATTFYSLPTTAAFTATIERSMFLAYHFGTPLILAAPVRLTAPPPVLVCPEPGSFRAACPLRNFG